MIKTAFVLGNGVSRAAFEIPTLQKYGLVYGCNALYRTDTPDYLISVDPGMVSEIVESGYHKTHKVWTNPRKHTKDIKGLNFFKPSLGWSSGPSALWLSAIHGNERVYILGFDYKGLDEGKKVNNIYAGTKNYKSENATATYFGNWLRQTCKVIKTHPKIEFIRVIQSDNYCPEELNIFENFTTITTDEFRKSLPYK